MVVLLNRLVAAVMRRRRSFPRWVNRLIDSIADNPTGILGTVVGRILWRYSPDDVPWPMRAPNGEPSVYIAPVNYAQQGYSWSRALQRSGVDAVNSAVEVPGGYSFEADRVVPMAVFERSKSWRAAELNAASAYSHVLIEAEKPIFSRLFDRDVERETEVLTARGVDVAFMAHGTDVRLPSRHAASSKWSPFSDPGIYFDRIESEAERNIAILGRLRRPTFASTPDLLDDLPFAHWCPVVVDLARWSQARPSYQGPLRVVHAPTNPQIKGTDLIEPTLQKLHAEGVIVYRRIIHVPHAQMPEVFANADVVLDQFRLGSFGVGACEAMAAGAITVAHTTEQVRARVKAATGFELPIVDATPDTLEPVLRSLARDRERLERLSAESRDYVREVHDGRMSARVLREHWIDRTDDAEDAVEVDVVIAVHDPTRAIDRAVASVVRSRRARAIVVCHDTPREGVVARLGTLAQHPRVIVHELQDGVRSPAGPFNAGLDLASARWVGVLGSDDEWEAGAGDAWLDTARRTEADVVIALVRDGRTGEAVPTPPVRARHADRLDPIRDRLAYRTAPLGIMLRTVIDDIRFTPGLASGEDIEFSIALWFGGHRLAFAERDPAYVVHSDAPARVSGTARPVADDLAFLPAMRAQMEGMKLTPRDREAIVAKVLRVNVFGTIVNRDPSFWTVEARQVLAEVTQSIIDIAPSAVRRMSQVEVQLLKAVGDTSTSPQILTQLARHRTDARRLRSVLTRDLRSLLACDAPLRFGLAALALRRRTRSDRARV
ncbi:glycosyltransferase [Microbacterium esteraromaticum]|nr:glycosyltransferase [Microbacterium esteraromaticum]